MNSADVRAAYAMAAHAAGLAGVDTSQWALSEGSVTYGRAYRIWDRDPVSGGLSRPRSLQDNTLGMARRETIATLSGMRTAWLAVAAIEPKRATA